MRQGIRSSVLVVLLAATAGCATGGAMHIPAAQPAWTREDLTSRGWTKCGLGECRNTLRTARGPITVATRVRSYGLHDIPGWNTGSTAGRVASGILGGLLRRQGMSTDRVEIRHGRHVLTDSGSTVWRLRCSVYSIDDQTEEYNREEDDHVTRSVRRSEGADCGAFDVADSTVVLWRFRSGVAPPRDSLAAVHDSLSRTEPAMVSATPPMSLTRLATDGSVAARYDVTRQTPATLTEQLAELHRVTIAREGGVPVAIIYRASGTSVDLAPEATGDEIRIVRLVAGLIAAESR